jgi:Est1 DNA/RNA binding domain
MNGPRRFASAAVSVDSQSELVYPANAAMLEEQLRVVQLNNDPVELTETRGRLCELYSDWIVNDPESAAAADAVSRLWKKCFYERINDDRKKITKDKKKGKDSTTNKIHLSIFLKEGITLTEFMIGKLREKLEESIPSSTTNGGCKCLYRLHICLGDLYRYGEKLDQSEVAYATASRLAPGCVHCLNQRAVVSDCRESTAVSAYWYIRAIHSHVDKPDKMAADNLQRLLVTNRAWLQQQQQDGAGAHDATVLCSNVTRLFFAKFVDLFQAHYLHEPIDPMSVLSCVNSFQKLLKSSAFSDPLLCKLIAILAVMDVHLYDFGLCLAERVAAALDRNKSSRRNLTPLLLLVEYALLKPDTTTAHQQEFWRNVVAVWNLVSPQEPEAVDVYLAEYEVLKGYVPFEPFVGKLMNYYLSDKEACASFVNKVEESPAAKIVRFLSLKSALLELDCIVENAADGSLAFQEPNPSNSPDFFVDENDVVDFDQNMEDDEGEDIVLDIPTPVVPASKATQRTTPSANPAAAAVAPTSFPFGIAALMGQTAPAGTMTSLPLLSGHVAPYQTSEETNPPVLAHAYVPSSVSNAIGPPPGFGGLFNRPSLFGDPRPSVSPNVNSLFPINMATANPFAVADFNGNTAAAASMFQSSFATVSQTKQSPNGLTKNPFAS